jgi:2-amino-4-hydroxy-6-hydroxymethyldihydropteridine diphosphokinase
VTSNLHSAILLIGSNVNPVENTRRALIELCRYGIIRRVSRPWQSPPFGSQGPDFINLALEFMTTLPLDELKNSSIAAVETKLGRQRSADKNAPRTIDVDIIYYDNTLLDQTIWERPYAAVTVAELLPDLVNSSDGRSLSITAASLINQYPMKERPDVLPVYKQKKTGSGI